MTPRRTKTTTTDTSSSSKTSPRSGRVQSPHQQLDFHFATDEAHTQFIRRHSQDVLRLCDEGNQVRVFAPSETRRQGLETPPEPSCAHKTVNADSSGNDGGDCIDSGGSGNASGLHVAAIMQCLSASSRWAGRILLHAAHTPSTQDMLRTVCSALYDSSGCAHGWVATADRQTCGRGRRGTVWQSPHGSVAISLALRIDVQHMNRLIFMQYVAAIAVVHAVGGGVGGECESISSECMSMGDNEVQFEQDVHIKWPNDVYVGGMHKVAGVLCEASTRQDSSCDVIVGIGANVSNTKPTASLLASPAIATTFTAGSPPAIRDTPAARETFVSRVVAALERLYDELCTHGFERRLRAEYERLWMHDGQEVHIGDVDGPVAVVQGLAPNGWVRVFRRDWQAVQDLPPETTSLDVQQRILMKKRVDNGKASKLS